MLQELCCNPLEGAVEGGVFRGITNMTQLGEMFAKGGIDAKRANVAMATNYHKKCF